MTGDPLDDLFRGEKTADGAPRKAPPEHYVAPETRVFEEKCIKCHGSGRFGRFGQCFACSGKGKRTFKTSQATREKQRGRRQEVKQSSADYACEQLKAKEPDVYAWLILHVERDEFATSVWNGLRTYGGLTDNQLAAIKRTLAKDAERAKRREDAPMADTDGVDRLKLAFDTAIERAAAKGRKFRWPRITIGDVVISPAKATSKNPGALYVKQDEQYLGKIQNKRFFAARECTPEQEQRVLGFIADPERAAKLYGQETKMCCICNAPLTNEESMQRGMGPICAEKMGW